MIFLEASLRPVPGKMKELTDVLNNEYVPASARLGRKLMGQWTVAIGTLDTLVDLWVYDDLAHMQRFNEARAKSPEFAAVTEKLRALIAYEETRLMYPTAISQIK